MRAASKMTQMAQLRKSRKERDRDEQVRFQLGLVYEGLWYEPHVYPARPKQLFRSVNGCRYVKEGAADYRRLPNGVCSDRQP